MLGERICTVVLILVSAFFGTSCSELIGGSGSFVRTTEGGDVPSTIQFQNYRFRTGAAFKATQLGAVGLLRTRGHNAFEIKTVPELSDLALVRSGSFTKNSRSEIKMIGNLSLSEIEKLDLGASGEYSRASGEAGIFTIYYVANTKRLVDQLNNKHNRDLKAYLSRSKDFRIITAIVKVNNHSLLSKSRSSVDFQVLAALEEEGKAEAFTAVDADGISTIEIKDTGKTLPRGLSLADGGTYAYEYSRVIWRKSDGLIIDLLVDRPGGWSTWADSSDHDYDGCTHDPKEVLVFRRVASPGLVEGVSSTF